ncbi:MAG TPA: 2-phosphoglycerate kinase, partial [Gammaproteobacteria bacterium]
MAKGDKNVKTQVLDSATAVRVPFLRGILTRSLQAAGLNFNQAYKLATQVRRELERTPEISSTALRDLLAERLAERHGDEYRQRYLQRQEATPSILVRYPGGNSLPFTPGAMSRSLESAALPVEQASAVAQRLLRRLQHDGCSEIDSQQLARLVHQDLQLHYGVEAAGRYLVWLEYRRSDRPLILLIGGINGVGKSTLAAELAHRLDIVRTQSTDMLREVMR